MKLPFRSHPPVPTTRLVPEGPVTLDESYALCREFNKRHGTTYYWSTMVLPAVKRHHVHALYAFARYADDIVDEIPEGGHGEIPVERRALALAEFGDRFFHDLERGRSDDPVLKAVVHTVRAFDIDPDAFRRFLKSMTMDLTVESYETWDDLRGYMDGSAAVIGEMMLPILEPHDLVAATPHARDLGDAFQLTNFLRDVREDVIDYGRVYIPQETLARFDVSDEQIRSLEFSRGVAEAVRSELESTEWLYVEGVAGIRHLPREYQFAVVAASVMYADHHRLIRDADFDVVSRRPTLSRSRRAWLLARTWWHWRRYGDPVRTFLASSSIDTEPSVTEGHRRHSGCSVTRLFRA